jgi:hypothetical protein
MKAADYSTLEDLQKRMVEQCDSLNHLVKAVAKARQIQDYSSDRKKNALATFVCAEQGKEKGLSVAMAEHRARCSKGYEARMLQLTVEDLDAETVVAQWEVHKLRWETARSLLSIQKQLVTNL